MNRVGCPFDPALVASGEVAADVVVLDADALLPSAVGSASPTPTAFHVDAADLLDELSRTMVRPSVLEERLRRLAAVAAGHADAFENAMVDQATSDAASLQAADLRDAEIVERIRYDRFFGVRRVVGLDGSTFGRTLFDVLGASLAEVASTPLGAHELRALLHGVVEATRWVDELEVPAAPVGAGPAPSSALRRFVLGHQLFAVMAAFARHQLDSVAADPMTEGAADGLLLASRFVRASTAAMWFTVSFPPAAYRDFVRPQMDAASSDVHGFSGGDNFDFRRMREAWERLHGCLVPQWDALDASTREAARVLYETIVLDNEHHTALAAEMVGLLPSLDADRQARRLMVPSLSAVSALRLNTDERRALRDSLLAETSRGCRTTTPAPGRKPT